MKKYLAACLCSPAFILTTNLLAQVHTVALPPCGALLKSGSECLQQPHTPSRFHRKLWRRGGARGGHYRTLLKGTSDWPQQPLLSQQDGGNAKFYVPPAFTAEGFFSLDDSLVTTKPGPSRGKAFLRSLLIPGWGQKSTGAKTSARTFFVAELTLWAGFIAFQVRGHWLEDDYRLFGTTHAGFNPSGKNDNYFADVGNYNSIDEYNQAQLRNRDVAALYDPATFYWKWDTDANRQRYDDLRIRSERAYSNSTFMIAGVLANHVISGIHAAYLARRHEQSQRQGTRPSPQFCVESSSHDIQLVARLQF